MPQITSLADLPPDAFAKADPTSDDAFYAQPRMVAHIGDLAIVGVTTLYRELVPPGAAILDLMSSRYSHLPPPDRLPRGEVVGHGMNAAELAANPDLDRFVTQNLNETQALPFDTDAFDAVLCCVSVQYLQHPREVFEEVRRLLRPGGVFVVTFSNRCFPTKAVAVWQALPPEGQAAYVAMAMREAGLDPEAREVIPPGGPSDPLWAVIGRAP